jgi:hypothetical protein
MQIVNGGQTTASIHRAAKQFEADLSKVYVQGKIVTVDPAQFNEVVPFISRYANSQNKVTDPDLQANHRFHVGLERLAKREWTPHQTSGSMSERAAVTKPPEAYDANDRPAETFPFNAGWAG